MKKVGARNGRRENEIRDLLIFLLLYNNNIINIIYNIRVFKLIIFKLFISLLLINK